MDAQYDGSLMLIFAWFWMTRLHWVSSSLNLSKNRNCRFKMKDRGQLGRKGASWIFSELVLAFGWIEIIPRKSDVYDG